MLGLRVFLKQRWAGVALGAAPAKQWDVLYTQNMNWGCGGRGYDMAKEAGIKHFFPLVPPPFFFALCLCPTSHAVGPIG